MHFSSACECRLVNMSMRDSEIVRYDVMSKDEHVGSLRFCPILSEWLISLSSYNQITLEFTAKIWTCLLSELSNAENR